MQHSHAAIIYNPMRLSLDRVRAAVGVEENRHGWAPTRWYPTRSDDAGRSAVSAAVGDAPGVLVVAGGDGTLRTAAEAVQGTGIPIAPVPSGTGNLLARNLGLPLNDIEASLAAAFGGTTRSIDIGIADLEHEDATLTRQLFLVMAGIGLDAEMAENTSAIAKKHVGWLAYVPPIARSVLRGRQFHLRYRIDGGPTRSTRAHTVIVGNCGTLTGNMLLLPSAVVDDGVLDVVMLRPKGPFGWARIGTRLTTQGIAHRSRFGRLLLGRAPAIHALAYAQGRQFDVRFDIPHPIELDGDGTGHIVGARITVDPGALQICVAGPAG